MNIGLLKGLISVLKKNTDSVPSQQKSTNLCPYLGTQACHTHQIHSSSATPQTEQRDSPTSVYTLTQKSGYFNMWFNISVCV